MIIDIGIDSIEIERFSHWGTYASKALQRTFSPEEINYCLKVPTKSAERFAVRFAAKEAFYKAFCSAFPDVHIESSKVFREVSLEAQSNGHVQLKVNWKAVLPDKIDTVETINQKVSLTHTKTVATAIVILQKK